MQNFHLHTEISDSHCWIRLKIIFEHCPLSIPPPPTKTTPVTCLSLGFHGFCLSQVVRPKFQRPSHQHPGVGPKDPTAPLTTTIASLDEGCVNLHLGPPRGWLKFPKNPMIWEISSNILAKKSLWSILMYFFKGRSRHQGVVLWKCKVYWGVLTCQFWIVWNFSFDSPWYPLGLFTSKECCLRVFATNRTYQKFDTILEHFDMRLQRSLFKTLKIQQHTACLSGLKKKKVQ